LGEKASNRKIYDDFVRDTAAVFPEYFVELQGQADGSGIDVDDFVLSNLRAELLQFTGQKKKSSAFTGVNVEKSCSDAFVIEGGKSKTGNNISLTRNRRNPLKYLNSLQEKLKSSTRRFIGYGHNDDWSQNWRKMSYAVEAYELKDESDESEFQWLTWSYPGFLSGMDYILNKHGLTLTVNSLFPKVFRTYIYVNQGVLT